MLHPWAIRNICRSLPLSRFNDSGETLRRRLLSRQNRRPRRSSSLSRSSSTMLDNNGDRGPPCRVPSRRGLTRPSSPRRNPAIGKVVILVKLSQLFRWYRWVQRYQSALRTPAKGKLPGITVVHVGAGGHYHHSPFTGSTAAYAGSQRTLRWTCDHFHWSPSCPISRASSKGEIPRSPVLYNSGKNYDSFGTQEDRKSVV